MYSHPAASIRSGTSAYRFLTVRFARVVSRLAAGQVSAPVRVESLSTTNSSSAGPTTGEPSGFTAMGAAIRSRVPSAAAVTSQPLDTKV